MRKNFPSTPFGSDLVVRPERFKTNNKFSLIKIDKTSRSSIAIPRKKGSRSDSNDIKHCFVTMSLSVYFSFSDFSSRYPREGWERNRCHLLCEERGEMDFSWLFHGRFPSVLCAMRKSLSLAIKTPTFNSSLSVDFVSILRKAIPYTWLAVAWLFTCCVSMFLEIKKHFFLIVCEPAREQKEWIHVLSYEQVKVKY